MLLEAVRGQLAARGLAFPPKIPLSYESGPVYGPRIPREPPPLLSLREYRAWQYQDMLEAYHRDHEAISTIAYRHRTTRQRVAQIIRRADPAQESRD